MNRLSQTGLFGALLTLSLACGPGPTNDPDGGNISPDGSVIVPDGGDTDGGDCPFLPIPYQTTDLTMITNKPTTSAEFRWDGENVNKGCRNPAWRHFQVDLNWNGAFEIEYWNDAAGVHRTVKDITGVRYTINDLAPNFTNWHFKVTLVVKSTTDGSTERAIPQELVFNTDPGPVVDPEWEKIKNVIHGKPWSAIVPPDGNVSAQGTFTLGEDMACTSGKTIKFGQNDQPICFNTETFGFHADAGNGNVTDGQITFCQNCASYTGEDLAVCLAHPHVLRCTPHWTTELEIDHKFIVIVTSVFNGGTDQSTFFSY